MKNGKDPIQRKSRSITGGVNYSDKSQLKKIQKIKHNKDIPNTPKGKLYMRVKGIWVFKGTYCRCCNVTMHDQIVIDNHHYICNNNKQNTMRDD